MTREQFYSQIQKWEKARLKWILAFCGYIGIIFIAMKSINNVLPFAIQNPLQAGAIIAALSIPAILLYIGTSNQTKKFNLICNSCNFSFEQYKHLTHIAFTNKCPKCGANVYSV